MSAPAGHVSPSVVPGLRWATPVLVLAAAIAWHVPALASEGTASTVAEPVGSIVFSDNPPRVPFEMPAVVLEPSVGSDLAGTAGEEPSVEAHGAGTTMHGGSEMLGAGEPTRSRVVASLPAPRPGDPPSAGARATCTRELAGDYLCYRCDDDLYQPVFYGGRLVYRLIEE